MGGDLKFWKNICWGGSENFDSGGRVVLCGVNCSRKEVRACLGKIKNCVITLQKSSTLIFKKV